MSDFESLAPSLRNVIEQTTLKWIFVGGKGGVGKTTCRLEMSRKLLQLNVGIF